MRDFRRKVSRKFPPSRWCHPLRQSWLIAPWHHRIAFLFKRGLNKPPQSFSKHRRSRFFSNHVQWSSSSNYNIINSVLIHVWGAWLTINVLRQALWISREAIKFVKRWFRIVRIGISWIVNLSRRHRRHRQPRRWWCRRNSKKVVIKMCFFSLRGKLLNVEEFAEKNLNLWEWKSDEFSVF